MTQPVLDFFARKQNQGYDCPVITHDLLHSGSHQITVIKHRQVYKKILVILYGCINIHLLH